MIFFLSLKLFLRAIGKFIGFNDNYVYIVPLRKLPNFRIIYGESDRMGILFSRFYQIIASINYL